jgi:hypothetical protein
MLTPCVFSKSCSWAFLRMLHRILEIITGSSSGFHSFKIMDHELVVHQLMFHDTVDTDGLFHLTENGVCHIVGRATITQEPWTAWVRVLPEHVGDCTQVTSLPRLNGSAV